ncbi:MAG: peptidylprolyl isomerase [SAR324 cluster bacterium]|nr:peptidylprolyl isomerase [SAR324 cluster bacterium]
MKFLLYPLVWLFWIAVAYSETQVIDYVRIIVNSQILTNSEVEDSLKPLREQVQQAIPEGPERDRQMLEMEKTVVENLVNKLLLLDRARELKLDVAEKDIEEQMDRLLERNPQLLSQYNEYELKEQISRDIKQQRVIGHEVESKIHVDDSEIALMCKSKNKESKELGIAQILLRKSMEEAKLIEQKVQAALMEGVPFDTLVSQYSDDPGAKKNGGKLGVFKKGQLLKEIDDAAFILHKGELGALVQSSFGFHLIYIYDEIVKDGPSCDDLSEDVRQRYTNMLFNEKRDQILQQYLGQLRSKARVVIKDKR